MDTDDKYGLIILGNSGAGKSFLANILLGRNVFVHEFSADSVTHVTEHEETIIGYYTLSVFNIPGLIEADQTRIDLNKREIDKAFAQRPNSIVMFVFGQTGGRLKDEDVVAFKAINEAYPFKRESLVLAVNDLQKDRPAKYEGTTIVRLQQLLGETTINIRNICFLDHISQGDAQARQHLKEKLLQVIVELHPAIHKKIAEIKTIRDELNRMKIQIRTEQQQFDTDRKEFEKRINDNERLMKEMNAAHKTEMESFERAATLQRERYEEAERRFQEANQKYETHSQELREQVARSEEELERIRRTGEANQQEILRTMQENQRLQNELIALKNQAPERPRKPRWYETTFDFLTKALPVVNLIPWSSFKSD